MSTDQFYLFLVASLMLNITPGNDMLYVASQSLSQGFRAGVWSSVGIFIGCVVHILAAAWGLSYLIAQSAFWFNLIKWTGALYLVWIGLQTLLTRSDFSGDLKEASALSPFELVKRGAITNALNPKVAIFFISFLPQFVQADSPNVAWLLMGLGFWFDVQGCLILIGIAYLLGKAGNFLKGNPRFWRIQNKLTGLIMLYLGVQLALARR